ncbi:hypothetical protein NP233_g11847 [Leucocoprinus birnbaumii]|uniref:Uncharacterized protein n=1 Tax=Leucocoprinus birnbaumii TaxID=56174 RepID=A0AAD5YQJ0_9AGAR|nr:hypothetical protein NP233_g11847 [Leucocoprinus birnbaumii]
MVSPQDIAGGHHGESMDDNEAVMPLDLSTTTNYRPPGSIDASRRKGNLWKIIGESFSSVPRSMMTEEYHHVFSLVKQEVRGRAWVVNGDLYYSPNCMRGVAIPEHQQGIKLKPGVSKASDFQEPIWWEKKTEWMACVLRQPVPYSGALVQALNVVPDTLMSVPNKGFGMSPEQVLPWKELETTLMGMVQALEEKLPLVVRAVGTQAKPFPPSKWGYRTFYPTMEEASRHIEAGRDWFAMWLGYVYWLSKKVYECAGYSDDSMAPMWYLHIIRACNDQPTYDLLRMTPLLQNQWKWNRVGVWLHNPDDMEEQPTAQWFMDRELQQATTWIAATPSSTYMPQWPSSSVSYTPVPAAPENVYSYHNSYSSSSSSSVTYMQVPATPDNGYSYENSYRDDGDYSQDAWMPTPSIDPPSSITEPPVEDHSRSMMTAKAAKAVWDEFWKKREATHERMLKAETEAKKMARLNREKLKPTVSAIVCEWGWDEDETPPIFTKKLVRKADRAETIMDFHKKVRRYDSYMNEWHLCHKFSDELYVESPGSSAPGSPSQNEVTPACEVPTQSSSLPPPPSSSHLTYTCGDRNTSLPSSSTQNEPLSVSSQTKEASTSPSLIESNQPSLPPNFLTYASGDPKSEEFKMEQTRTEVLRLLGRRFGFVPPLPVPLAVAGHVLESDMRSLLKGRGPAVVGFLGLARDNRQTLAFNARVNSIRTLTCVGGKKWYMFDRGASHTVDWSIAVASATDALYVCRLDPNMTEKEIALDLAEEGVRFHTVQRRDTLAKARRDRSALTYVPMRLSGHVFNQRDFDFYRKQTECIVSLPRARAAVMRGGFARRIAIEFLSISEVTKGPSGVHKEEGHMFIAKDTTGAEYVDDDLTVGEFEALCGLYVTFTGSGQQAGKLSWYPLPYVFDGQGEDMGWWTGRAEKLWETCNASILSNDPQRRIDLPKAVMKWRDRLRGFGDGRRAVKSAEEWSKRFLESEIGES